MKSDNRFIPPSDRDYKSDGHRSSWDTQQKGRLLDHAAYMDERAAELEAEREEWSIRYEQMRKRVQQEVAETLNAKGERDSNRTMRWFAEAQAKLSQAKLFEADERDARQRDLIRRLADSLDFQLDDETCSFDHNGCCQMHGDFGIGVYGDSRPCYMVTARELIAEARGIEATNE